jgi:hypothetical protein
MALLDMYGSPQGAEPKPQGALYSGPRGILDPRAMMLLGMSQGFFKAGQPTSAPTGLGGALAGGIQGGIGGLMQSKKLDEMYQMNALRQAQMEEIERKTRAGNLQNERISSLAQSLPEADRQMFLAAPDKYLESHFKKFNDNPFAKINPKDYTSESLTKYQQTGNVSDLVTAPPASEPTALARLIAERQNLPPNDPRIAQYDDAIKKATTPQPLVQIGEETAFNKRLGGELGEQYANLQKAAFSAPATIAKYERLGSLLGQVNTGKFKGATTELKSAAKGVGIDLSAMGITDDVAPAQAARALANQLALEMRNPAGGAGMPGAMSDKDREFLVQSIPGLENDPSAIGQMIEYRKRIAKREQKVANMAREYRKKNGGRFDEGFYDELAQWSERNPLFPEAGRETPMPELSPKAQKYLNQAGQQ